MLFRMCLESVRWDGQDGPSMLIFSDVRDGGKLNVEIPETIGFDLQTLFNQVKDGDTPYFGILETLHQIGAKVEKLIIRDFEKPRMATMLVDIGERASEVELFFADIVSIAIIEDMPIYFDSETYRKNELPLYKRLLFTRTSYLTQYSFDTHA